jgi:general secretion pathway protein C
MLALVLAVTCSSAALDRAALARLFALPLIDSPELPVRMSAAPVTLLGTMVGVHSAALVIDGKRGRTLYVGDLIAGATVADITHDRLLLDRNGALEEIRGHAAAGTASPAPPGDLPHVSFAEISRDSFKLMTQIRAVPVANGFKVFAIAPDSLFSRLGLKNGDVIHAGLDLLQKVKPGSALTVEIERDGRTFSLSGWID